MRARPARRSLWVLVLMGAGFVIARWLGGWGGVHALMAAPSSAWFGAACVLVLAGVFARGWWCRLALGAAVMLAAGGWFTLRVVETPRDALAPMLDPDPLAGPSVMTIEGVVREKPRRREAERGEFDSPAGEAKWVVELEADTVNTAAGPVRASGGVRVFVAGDAAPPVREGQRIRVTGATEPVCAAGNPGEFDIESWARQEGLAGTMSVPGAELVEVIEGSGGMERLRAGWLAWRGWLRERAEAALGGEPPSGRSTELRSARREEQGKAESRASARTLLRSVLLGERDPELREVQGAFVNLGLVHLVAISGFNLAVMAFIALFLLRATGDRGWLEPALLALVVGLYMIVLPAQTPIIRSGLLVLALLLTEAGGRRYDRLSTLGWIGCGLLLWKPLDLWSLGFELSMGVTGVLLWQGHRFADRLFGAELRGLAPDRSRTWDARLRRAARAAWRLTKQTAAASVLAWLVATPVVIWQTGMFSPLAPLTTLLVLPLVTVVLWAGYLALVIGMCVPGAAALTGGVLDLLASLLIDVVLVLDALPGMTFNLPRVSVWWAFAATACALWCCARGRLRWGDGWAAGWRDRAGWIAAGMVVVWLIAEVAIGPRLAVGGLRQSTALRIDTLAVGDGTCHLLRAGGRGDEAMLWDCGSLTARIGERVVRRAVRDLGAWKVRTAVVTHANVDHYSGLADVAGPLGVRVVLVSRAFADEAERAPWGGPGRLLAALRARGIEVRTVGAGDGFALGGEHGASVEFVWPPEGYTPRLVNDASLVARITPGIRGRGASSPAPSLLLTGDIRPASMAGLLAAGPGVLGGVGILELPHHGSVNETAIEFVRAVSPAVVLQSTGPRRAVRGQSGGWETLREGRVWWVTARDGAAWGEVGKDGDVRSGSRRAPAR